LAAVVYQFPSLDDRQAAQTIVSEMAWSKHTGMRVRAQKALRYILDKYGVTKLPLESCIVSACKTPKFASVMARKKVTGPYCPGCGASIYDLPAIEGELIVWPDVRIMSIREGFKVDKVTYACSRCGAIFWKEEAKTNETFGKGG
jgi:predicted RNA-binding Zn-ribbon protein involved in translation (DUF1610 family)